MTRTVGIYLYDEVEVLDFAGPFEVFSTAARLAQRQQPGAPRLFEVVVIAETLRPVRARGGLTVQPRFSLGTHPPLSLLIIPGGVVTAELERKEVLSWIASSAKAAEITASVCTGAFLLAKAGLLDGKRATTHWEYLDEFRRIFPKISVQEEVRWVDEGQVVTSAGISAGIEMALHLVARLDGEELAQRTARQIDFDWKPG